jgi:hypothetical protein
MLEEDIYLDWRNCNFRRERYTREYHDRNVRYLKVTIDKDNTTIVSGAGEADMIKIV